MKLSHPEGATPIDADQLAGLIPDLTTQAELNEWEQANILSAEAWLARNQKRFRKIILSQEGVRTLHKQMFHDTWRWAGKYRKVDTNIGVPWFHVATEVENLMADASLWLNQGTFNGDELGVRLHHRLVAIHPFANGNGRHARLLVDVLRTAHGHQRFSWGATDLSFATENRSEYIAALQEADQGSLIRLLRFAKAA